MSYVSEALLYLCFAILTGTFILRVVPEHRRPQIHTPSWLLLLCTLAIPVLEYVPIHDSAVLFAKDTEIPYGEMVKNILLELNNGKAWIWSAVASVGLAFLLGLPSFRNDKHMPKVGLFIMFLLILWLGYASHATSLYGTKGWFVHSAHFLAVTVWIGVLMISSWFASGSRNWEAFLAWFSPVAIGCMLIAFIAGIMLMTFTTPQYVNSWMLPYGQMLLLKHLLIAPLLLFAYTNGFGYRKKLKENTGFNPLPWLKAESLIALLLFIVTGVLGQQTPPHDVKETLQTVSPSKLFTTIYNGHFSPDLTLKLSVSLESILMLAAALVMIYGLIQMYKENKLLPAFVMGLMTSVFGYFALMFSVG
ncbi:CopD family protein [Paenibacillus glycanilyticus]|uniref:copper resistance D family protein n=1 Tax=Paenibacillus glycanilyticus TaxID=126569 RepID=UPI0020415964|nr:CopD family protein [Paenibacillus glycanilyticus]MCM3630145.1 CopD family protein [Paenibacillus glycanilyticus]